MTTMAELRNALAREEPSAPPDLDAIMRGGSRIRRRRQVGVGAACLTVAVAAVGGFRSVVTDDLTGRNDGPAVSTGTGPDLHERAKAGERIDARVQQLLDPVAPIDATSVSGFSWKNDDADDGKDEPLEQGDLPYVLHWQLDYDVTSAPGESVWVLAQRFEGELDDPGNMGLCGGRGLGSRTPICRTERLRDGSYLLSIEGDISYNGTWERRVVHHRVDRLYVLVSDTVPVDESTGDRPPSPTPSTSCARWPPTRTSPSRSRSPSRTDAFPPQRISRATEEEIDRGDLADVVVPDLHGEVVLA